MSVASPSGHCAVSSGGGRAEATPLPCARSSSTVLPSAVVQPMPSRQIAVRGTSPKNAPVTDLSAMFTSVVPMPMYLPGAVLRLKSSARTCSGVRPPTNTFEHIIFAVPPVNTAICEPISKC